MSRITCVRCTSRTASRLCWRWRTCRAERPWNTGSTGSTLSVCSLRQKDADGFRCFTSGRPTAAHTAEAQWAETCHLIHELVHRSENKGRRKVVLEGSELVRDVQTHSHHFISKQLYRRTTRLFLLQTASVISKDYFKIGGLFLGFGSGSGWCSASWSVTSETSNSHHQSV